MTTTLTNTTMHLVQHNADHLHRFRIRRDLVQIRKIVREVVNLRRVRRQGERPFIALLILSDVSVDVGESYAQEGNAIWERVHTILLDFLLFVCAVADADVEWRARARAGMDDREKVCQRWIGREIGR
jgi:hypothetical protein